MWRLTLVLATLSLACDSTEPGEPAPDLTGFYNLVSLKSPELARGATLKPPVVGGTLEFGQYSSNEERALGDVSFHWELHTTADHTSAGGSGAYRQETNGGPIAVRIEGREYKGSYTLAGDTLALDLVEGAFSGPVQLRIPKGRTVWLRDESH